MIIPDMYNFISSLGGENYKGYVILLFTLSAGICRPFSGKITDKIGRVPVMVFGSLVGAVSCLAYIFTGEIAAISFVLSPLIVFFFIRFFHGLSTGFKPTGTAAMIADITPKDRRGEALGWFGFAGSLGMGIGPSIGSFIKIQLGYDALFFTSFLASALSVVIILFITETLEKESREKLNWRILKITKEDFFEPRVLTPALVFFLYAFSFGAVFTLIPDKQEMLGIENKGFFFTIYILITALTRIVSGRFSDKYGRRLIVGIGFIFLFTSMFLLAFGESIKVLIISAVIYGLAHGTTTPSIYAWVTDLSHEKFRGRAFTTMFIGMEFGIGMGAYLASIIYNNEFVGFQKAFLFINAVALVGFIILIVRKR